MVYVNVYQCCGYVVRDFVAERKGQYLLAAFTVALNRPGSKKPFYIDCVGWEEMATQLADRLRRGSLVFLSGELETSAYIDARGSHHKNTQLRVDKFSLLAPPKNPVEGEGAVLKRPDPPM